MGPFDALDALEILVKGIRANVGLGGVGLCES